MIYDFYLHIKKRRDVLLGNINIFYFETCCFSHLFFFLDEMKCVLTKLAKTATDQLKVSSEFVPINFPLSVNFECCVDGLVLCYQDLQSHCSLNVC